METEQFITYYRKIILHKMKMSYPKKFDYKTGYPINDAMECIYKLNGIDLMDMKMTYNQKIIMMYDKIQDRTFI